MHADAALIESDDLTAHPSGSGLNDCLLLCPNISVGSFSLM